MFRRNWRNRTFLLLGGLTMLLMLPGAASAQDPAGPSQDLLGSRVDPTAALRYE